MLTRNEDYIKSSITSDPPNQISLTRGPQYINQDISSVNEDRLPPYAGTKSSERRSLLHKVI